MNSEFSKLNQELYNKAIEKIGLVFPSEGGIVPDSLVVQQASGFPAARFAASLVKEGALVADLTAGLGVNTIYFSKRASKVFAIERDKARAEALSFNLKLLKIENVEVVNCDCQEWLDNLEFNLDTIFIDPSRRDGTGKKLFRLEECSPDIISLFPLLRKRCNQLLVKCSPILDIKEALKIFPELKNLYLVEYKREVREVLLEIFFPPSKINFHVISCVSLNEEGISTQYDFTTEQWNDNEGIVFLKGKDLLGNGGFIYEPSPAIMKAGFWGTLMRNFPSLVKLAPNTHLFYSPTYYSDFPGRVFKIDGILSSKDLKKLKGEHFNTISRNHPATANELVQRFRLCPSQDKFLIACTAGKDKTIIETTRI